MKRKVAGILGGMGPEATIDLMKRVLRATPAQDDRDHVHLLVDNNPQVPSRIQALLEKTGESPGPCLCDMARKLESWGADFLAMPCNTAHYYHKEIQEAVSIPVLNIISLSVEECLRRKPHLRHVGLLASTAVLNLNLYDKAFALHGVEVVVPAPPTQERVMAAIRQIKTGRYGGEIFTVLREAMDSLLNAGAEIILVACTELSIVSEQLETSVPVMDAAQILAERIVHEAKPVS